MTFREFVGQLSRRWRLGAVAACALVAACTTPAVNDITAVIGNGPAQTALAYVGALSPTVSADLAKGDTWIAANAPKILREACGVVSMGDLVIKTALMIDPKLGGNSSVPQGATALATVDGPAGPCAVTTNAPPRTIAQAAQLAVAAYGAVSDAIKAAGVKP